MNYDSRSELYQQVILDHNKNPRNFRKIDCSTYKAEGYNPLCGDHLTIYFCVNKEGVIHDIAFQGDGCAISKASASLMTTSLRGKTIPEAIHLFDEFHKLIMGNLDPNKDQHQLGKLAVFCGIWHFPTRVKCASLCWHALKGAIEHQTTISTES